MEKEQGKWEKIIRSKLYDFEADVNPGDWDIISGKLPGGRSVRLHPYRRYGYAAAVAAVLLIAGGLYFYPNRDGAPDAITAAVEQDADVMTGEPVESAGEKELPPAETPPVPDGKTPAAPVEKPVDNSLTASRRHTRETLSEPDAISVSEPSVRLKPLTVDEMDSIVMKITGAEIAYAGGMESHIPGIENMLAGLTSCRESPVADASSETGRSRWSFGMGGGGYGANTTSGDFIMSPLSAVKPEEDIYMINKKDIVGLRNGELREPDASGYNDRVETRAYEVPTGEIEHKMPISAGLGVSYYLNDRWSLQSGLTYTLLRSEWAYHNTGELAEFKQYLHFLGVPLSVSYRIAEWKRFQLYASAGGMCEFNVAGKYKKTVTSEGLATTDVENLHMKEPLWSLNARAGINYPLWKFINVYAEAGVSRYFDNKSKIQTIRSDKPFNVSLQAGIRLGF
ncbi:MAG: PorT family protein [Tannerella sp.]|jgi:opacity protein-like surface antigen|nr:PorT family protein [Tannerella sp.]